MGDLVTPRFKWPSFVSLPQANRTGITTFSLQVLKMSPTTLDFPTGDKNYKRELKQKRFWATHINPGSESFSPLSCHDGFKFEVLSGFSLAETICPPIEVKHHVYVQRLVRIYTTLPSFPFTCRLLFITSTRKLVVSRNFSSIRIVLSCFYVLIFYFEKFSTWIWRMSFAVYAKLKLSNIWAQLLSKHAKKSSSAGLTCVAAARRRFCLSPLKFSLVRGFLWRESPLVGGGTILHHRQNRALSEWIPKPQTSIPRVL